MDEQQEVMDIAAQVMDEECPDWFDRIDFKRLRMSDSGRCIAGQCGLYWGNLSEEVLSRVNRKRIPYSVAPFASPDSVPYWKRAVMERKNPNNMEIGTPEKEYTIEPAEPVPGVKESPAPEPRKEPAAPEREKVPA